MSTAAVRARLAESGIFSSKWSGGFRWAQVGITYSTVGKLAVVVARRHQSGRTIENPRIRLFFTDGSSEKKYDPKESRPNYKEILPKDDSPIFG